MTLSPITFFGAYVVKADLTMGWNGESGFCSLELVESPDDGIFYTPPALNTACLFICGELEFGGIFRKTEYRNDIGGRRYQVTIESPAMILNGVQVILSAFQGDEYIDDTNYLIRNSMLYGGTSPTNVINIFAEKENYNYGGSFGNANYNAMGYPVVNLIEDFNTTIANGNFGGPIHFGESLYSIDLSALSEVIADIPNYRISGDILDITSLLGNITDIALYDYTSTLTGTPNELGVLSDPTIKIKVLSRRNAPTPGMINHIISEHQNKPDLQKNLVSYSTGKEATDAVTQKVLFGGNASRYWIADQTQIIPIWGKEGIGSNSTYSLGSSMADYNDWTKPIRIIADGGDDNNFTTITDATLLEIRCAASGREAWAAYHILRALKTGSRSITFGKWSITSTEFAELLEGNLSTDDLVDTSIENADALLACMNGVEDGAEIIGQRTVNARFQALVNCANEFYGRQFLVRLPDDPGGYVNNFKWVITEPKPESSWEVAASAWAGDNAFTEFPDLQFFDSDGRLGSTVIYPYSQRADFSVLGGEYTVSRYTSANGGIVSRANIDSDFGVKWIDVAIVDSLGFFAGIERKPFCKVDIQPVPQYDQYSTFNNGFNILCNLMMGSNVRLGYHNLFGFENFDFEIAPHPLLPSFIGVPQESKRFLWGPWYSFNQTAGQKGKVHIENDSSFVPENFGSIAAMNTAARSIINADLDMAFESETGFMELAELPTASLADRFLNSGPYITQMSISISAEGGFLTTYNFQNWTKKFAALSRYNVETLKKSRSIYFQYFRSMRDLFRNPPLKGIRVNLLRAMAKKEEEMDRSTDMITGTFLNGIARGINRQNPNPIVLPSWKRVRASVRSSTTNMGMRSIAASPETFAISKEQMYTPLFTYNQNNITGLVYNYNISITGQKSAYNFSGQLDPRDIYPSVQIYDSGSVQNSGMFYGKAVSPTSQDLDPYFYFPSTDFAAVAKDGKHNTKNMNIKKDPIKNYVRSMAVRGPVMLSGWGYDTKGLPVPMGTVVDASGFTIPSGAPDPYRFHDEAATDRRLWKTGPLDVRWHNVRKTWVGGAEMLEGYLMEDLSEGYSTARMAIVRLPSGSQITGTGEYLTLTNRDTSLTASSGAYCVAVDINEEWRPIYIGC